jgi:hypothetical protein
MSLRVGSLRTFVCLTEFSACIYVTLKIILDYCDRQIVKDLKGGDCDLCLEGIRKITNNLTLLTRELRIESGSVTVQISNSSHCNVTFVVVDMLRRAIHLYCSLLVAYLAT